VEFQGLRTLKKRSILGVCEYFSKERNAEITFFDVFVLAILLH
jgi:hypothetical protein